MARIYILDESMSTRSRLIESLTKRNHRVEGFSTISNLEKAMNCEKPDLLILEVKLQDGDGFKLVERLKRNCYLPVIFLTSRSSSSDRIKGLKVGADDYVIKPFSLKELALRIEAILRRYHP